MTEQLPEEAVQGGQVQIEANQYAESEPSYAPTRTRVDLPQGVHRMGGMNQRNLSAQANVANCPPHPIVAMVAFNTGWDDLAGIYAAIISSINQADSLVVQSQEVRLAQGWVPSQRDAAVMTGYVNDVRAILERAQALWGLHCTRRGGTTSPDDHGEMLSLATKYFELKDLYQSTVVPLVNRLVSATPT